MTTDWLAIPRQTLQSLSSHLCWCHQRRTSLQSLAPCTLAKRDWPPERAPAAQNHWHNHCCQCLRRGRKGKQISLDSRFIFLCLFVTQILFSSGKVNSLLQPVRSYVFIQTRNINENIHPVTLWLMMMFPIPFYTFLILRNFHSRQMVNMTESYSNHRMYRVRK